MAWFEVDIFEKCVAVDLHKYSHRTALIVAREKINIYPLTTVPKILPFKALMSLPG